MNILLSFLEHHRELVLDHRAFPAGIQVSLISILLFLVLILLFVDVVEEFLLGVIFGVLEVRVSVFK